MARCARFAERGGVDERMLSGHLAVMATEASCGNRLHRRKIVATGGCGQESRRRVIQDLFGTRHVAFLAVPPVAWEENAVEIDRAASVPEDREVLSQVLACVDPMDHPLEADRLRRIL